MRKYLGVCDATGSVTQHCVMKKRSRVAFEFLALTDDARFAEVTTERWDHVRTRASATKPPRWQTFITALGMPRKIRDKAAELREKGIEVECSFLGVPKRMISNIPQTCSTWVPGAFAYLSATGLSEVVLLCAPASETEWYCMRDQGAFTIDCLVFVDMGCELVSLTPEMVERGQRFQDQARMHSEDFSSVAAVAAVRAELARARLKSF